MGAIFLTTNPTRHHPLLNPFRRTREARAPRRGAAGFTTRAADVSLGAGGFHYDKNLKFPRKHVWDPYKRLGVTHDASEEEIRGARNFLLEQYAGHESCVESIEAAYENILMKSFKKRKKEKINLKSRLKKQVEESPSWLKRLFDHVEFPPVDTILRRLFLFVFMAGWSITSASDAGPAFQVALSLGSCIYFLNDKMKDVKLAAVTGFMALVVGWLCGSILIPLMPSFIVNISSLELLTSLFCFASLFLACTFLK